MCSMGSRGGRGRGRRSAAWLLLASGVLLAGCVRNPPRLEGAPGVSARPDVPWQAPAGFEQASARPVPSGLPEDFLARSGELTLADLADVALRNSPVTAEAWARARAAAGSLGSERGAYFPEVEAGASVTRIQGAIANGRIAFFQRSYAPSLELTWMLFDSGGREAAVEGARQALAASDFEHNAAIQEVILGVARAYWQYVTSKALLESERVSLEEFSTALEAARERHRAGLATIAEVLQAQTALAQAQLEADRLEGEVYTTRGALATAMGLPASTPYDVALPSAELPAAEATEAAERLLEAAMASRPDLAALRAQAEKARAHVREVRAEGLPSLRAVGSLGRTYYDNRHLFGNTYNVGLQLRIPVFSGFSRTYELQRARAEAQAAEEVVKGLEQRVAYEVWAGYYALRTAQRRLATVETLLQSAAESHAAALGRYKAGVGGILELLSAQAALEDARAQGVQARGDWYAALVQLARDTGTLGLESPALRTPVTLQISQEESP